MALTQKMVERDALTPNPWNPNKMQDRTFAAEKESIGRFGFVDPITVRPHPELDGKFQIIDGEHRWRAAGELDIKKVPVVVLTIGDAEAKKLTIVLNETRGEADTVDLAVLLADIAREDENLLEALPYSQDQLDALLAMADIDMPDYGSGDDDGAGSDPDPEADWQTISCRVPATVALVWEQAVETAQDRGDLDPGKNKPEVVNGLALEVLAASYMAT